VLAAQGASFLAFRGTGELAERGRRWARRLWIGEALLFVAMIGPTYAVRDEMLTNLTDHPWRLVFPLLAIAALGAMFVLQRAREWARAFVASSVFIVGLLTAGLYPNLVAAREGNPHSLTVDNAAAGSHTLKAALIWWSLGMALAAVYFVFAYRDVLPLSGEAAARDRPRRVTRGGDPRPIRAEAGP
jgi:cytochrome bd ubiquinol oxidase subunit II